MCKLFSYLEYDQCKTEEIKTYLDKFCKSKAPTIEELNKRVEKGEVEYYDENVTAVTEIDAAKYMILDTNVPMYRNGKASTVCVSIVKRGLTWTGGRVGPKDEMIEHFKNYEYSKTNNYMAKNSEMTMLQAAAAGDKEALESYEKMRNERLVKITIPDKTVDDIRADLLDKSGFWSADRVKYCISTLTQMVRKVLHENDILTKENGVILNADGTKVIFNSGFIGQNLAPICLVGEVVHKDDDVFVNNLTIRPGKAKLEAMNFSVDEMEPPMVYREKFVDLRLDLDRFDFDDRDRNLHCIDDRKERISEKAEGMSTRELTRRLADSIEIAINMENAYGDFIVPFFYIEDNEIQLFAPLYLSDAVKLDQPDAAIIIGEENGYYVPKTILGLKEAYKNAIVLNRCRDNIWLGRKYAE